MHREVAEKSAQLRAKKRAQKDPFRRTPNFQLGDYVLIGIPEPTVAGKKLFLKWRGPYCITDTKNNYIFEVEKVIGKDPAGWLWSHNRWKTRHLKQSQSEARTS